MPEKLFHSRPFLHKIKFNGSAATRIPRCDADKVHLQVELGEFVIVNVQVVDQMLHFKSRIIEGKVADLLSALAARHALTKHMPWPRRVLDESLAIQFLLMNCRISHASSFRTRGALVQGHDEIIGSRVDGLHSKLAVEDVAESRLRIDIVTDGSEMHWRSLSVLLAIVQSGQVHLTSIYSVKAQA